MTPVEKYILFSFILLCILGVILCIAILSIHKRLDALEEKVRP